MSKGATAPAFASFNPLIEKAELGIGIRIGIKSRMGSEMGASKRPTSAALSIGCSSLIFFHFCGCCEMQLKPGQVDDDDDLRVFRGPLGA